MRLDADGLLVYSPSTSLRSSSMLQGLGYLCAMAGDGTNDDHILSHTKVGIAAEGATDAAHHGADIILTEPSLSTIVHAIRGSRVIFLHMWNCKLCLCHDNSHCHLLCHLGGLLQVPIPTFHGPYHRSAQ
jgi:H+-transporting ATPase